MTTKPDWVAIVLREVRAEETPCQCHDCNGNKCLPGHAGHFIGAEDCHFLLHDGNARYCVSTVGDYRPGGGGNISTSIGYQRNYETMVFDKQRKRDRWSEIDFDGYQTEAEARAGHAKLLARYIQRQPRRKP
jgi:hypothetical protein